MISRVYTEGVELFQFKTGLTLIIACKMIIFDTCVNLGHIISCEITYKTRKCVYETLCPQLVSHFQDVKMSKK